MLSADARVAAARPRIAIIATLFVLHLLPFLSRPALIGGDEPHYALMAHSLASGDFDIGDEYDAVARGGKMAGERRAGEELERHLRDVNGRIVFSHPIGLPALASPLRWVQLQLAPNAAPDFTLGLFTLVVTFAGFLAIARTLAFWSESRATGLALAAAIWFSTPLWFYGRIFMTEGFIASFAALAVACALRRRWLTAALFLFLMLAMKETAAILALFIVLGVVLLDSLKGGLLVLIGPAVWGVSFAIKNLILTGSPFSTFQRYAIGDLAGGANGLLFSLQHGFVWFAPLALVGIAGWLFCNRGKERIVAALALASTAVWFGVAAAWVGWEGGSCYGPRLLIPVIPIAGAGLYPLLRRIHRARFIAIAATLAGVVVNGAAAIDPFTAFWEASAIALVIKNPAVWIVVAAFGTLAYFGFLRADAQGGAQLSR